MTNEELLLQISARLSAHEFLLENLYASLLLKDGDPVTAAESFRDRLLTLASRGWSHSLENEGYEDLAIETERVLGLFGDKVLTRVMDGAGQQGR